MCRLKQLLLILLVLSVFSCSRTPQVELGGDNPDSMSVAEPVLNPYQQINSPVDQQASLLFLQAQQAVLAADLDTAINSYQQLADRYPEYSGPLLNLAIIYHQQHDSVKAEIFFQKTLSVNKLNLQAYSAYGAFLRSEGRFDEAEKIYLTGLSFWNDVPAIHKNIAILYDLYMGKFELAYEHYQQYLQLLEKLPESRRDEKEIKQVSGWLIDIERRMVKQTY